MALGFSTSISGLLAQAYAISNTGSNIANASTTGFKATTMSFEDLVSESASDLTDGAGTTATTTYQNDAQGVITAAASGTYLAIDGDGYFAVQTGTVNADGTVAFNAEVLYSRCGDFGKDRNGYLMNSEGYYLLGYAIDPATGGVGDTLIPIQITSDMTAEAVATTQLEYIANLNANAETWTMSSAALANVYDSEGDEHDVSYVWAKVGDNTWNLTASAAGGAYDAATGLDNEYRANILVTFDGTGAISSIDNTGSGYTVVGNTISFGLQYANRDPQTVSCDLSNVSQFASSVTADARSFVANGVPAGSYSSMSIDGSGNVAVNYTNGASQVFYEIPVAQFTNSNGLELLSGGGYRATLASGLAAYAGFATDGATRLAVSSLESSNVDLASEFTTMIKSQQVYSANAKTISAINEMMKTLIELQI